MSFESSCDETSVAIIEDGHKILSNIVATQIKSHQRFGGVVPEVASRHHIEEITICVDDAMREANVTYDDIDAIAVTYGPGLVGALLIGVTAAKTIAWAHDIPLIPVNHIAGHILAGRYVEKIEYPALALVVSGGHTELVLMPEEGEFKIIGETRDDAAGEAYDKVGRVLGINYPAGPKVDEMASKGKDTFDFPRAMEKDDNFDFSFSGLKSAFLNTTHHADQIKEKLNKDDLATSFQDAVVDVLVYKTKRALAKYPVHQLILAGGVAANHGLRSALDKAINDVSNTQLVKVPLKLCGDNAAMIGAAGYVLAKKNIFAGVNLNADPSLDFDLLEDK
ncbi:tRNA (adenosine(37)-N6)-threonylcarbamoyltransferase complex transferase subunit TsaD [Apilactobacillus timberlakei]|uniref:tRNA N6-adenosine threonylcarbamoyltransferase n=1 Tax=Apilactobacillus timberlakei TaxID=2008380 RepID=A0ABY2YWK8_9LACO|nr:tRNA (adenosine(37)-N6)-threonylcarbamoyltransferase complex transferase subunit TsaD [Apilactobacillus timberlakei]TPR13550.1 tRNA (adenosine(37)-N6)-threonylcarbamoyltransferase complex transferase subunit TsaD [Apilactobacillus timberlakei]TPR15623.1 tRNA (adenosine(37)-N6)-threonylcarbamoyltransferase complex transferase subunit TsaD [Apilactobacillus timberlakei]TPR17872.1 tRNA (adenosine(37)-N6)-threonylcarbamoyltransferase complex transferase subunit TsaD [Apilactobacillus timberlakei]